MRFPVFFACLVLAGSSPISQASPLRFNRDIRPILSENCFFCHGQDASKRKADLRLDTFEGATAKLDDGAALVPGKPEASGLLQRLESHDPDEQMPPPDANRRVSPAQIALIRQWIMEGGAYENHWAFVPPEWATLPTAAAWDREPWDAFVRTDLARAGLEPSPEALPAAWLRRASFDLTGLAPLPAELDAFAADVDARGGSAYRAAAERLMASPRYGERMAVEWMDVARYADTHGFNNDSMRSMWRWRDWVIQAFNRNLPYNQFITKQLAGDLLHEPTLDDRIATGFGRNHVINSEGGIIEEEYRVEYVADRVRTLGMAWLGLTLECSRCHDHKYDPVTARDYYRLYAFFNQVPEWGEDGRAANAAPLMSAPTETQQDQLAVLDKDLSELAAAADPASGASLPLGEALAWLKQGVPEVSEPPDAALRIAVQGEKLVNEVKPEQSLGGALEPAVVQHPVLGTVLSFPSEPAWKVDSKIIDTASGKAWTWQVAVRWRGRAGVLLSSMNYGMAESSVSHGQGMEIRLTEQGRVEVRIADRWPAYAIQLESELMIRPGEWRHIAVVNHGNNKAAGLRVFIDGMESSVNVRHDGLTGSVGAKTLVLGKAAGPQPDAYQGEISGLRAWPKALGAEELRGMADGEFVRLATARNGYTEAVAQLDRVQMLRRRHLPETKDAARRQAELAARRLELKRAFPGMMVMAELPQPRPTHVLLRGTYDAPGEAVTAGVPEALLGTWPAGAPQNRLGLAQWLTKPDHPLTARVVVNRFWQQVFGIGLVKTSEDFGFQSEYPLHPELLDWLAKDFVESGWNVKALMRSIVLSAAYRQDSKVSAALAARDPENRLLGRGPRLRLQAEMIRDHAFAVSGLLRERLGGPSVFPEQPVDLYKGLVTAGGYPGTSWTNGTGEDLYRRSLYTFWKRTVPHPVMNVFDTPDREFGCVRRSRTNTPLQALTLMNEPALIRAAGHLGQRMLTEGGTGDGAKLAWGFRLATSRTPEAREMAILTRLLMDLRKSYQADAPGAAAMLQSGGITAPPDAITEAAAWTALGSNLLNLDETITKN